jgi:hypothetical protein
MKSGVVMSYYKPSHIFVDDAERRSASTDVPADGNRRISTEFTTTPADWDSKNVLVICPVIRTIDKDGFERTAICEGFVSSFFQHGFLSGPPGRLVRLLPSEANKACP